MGGTAIALDSADDASFRALLHASLLEALDRGRHGCAGAAASNSLLVVREALCAKAVDVALRTLDHAWRCYPDDLESLAPIYCRLLALEARDHDAALRLLQRATELGPDPEVAALTAISLLSLHRPEEARTQITTALGAYSVTSSSLLSHAAGQVISDPRIATLGWMGLGPDLSLIGEISAHHSSRVLDIQIDGGVGITRLVKVKAGQGRRLFHFRLPPVAPGARLDVSMRGVPLLGSGTTTPRHFALDGRAAVDGTRLTGWARLGWSPSQSLSLRIEDEEGHSAAFGTSTVVGLAGRWSFDIDVQTAGVTGERIVVSAQLPDGRWQALPDSPVLCEPAARLAASTPGDLLPWGKNAPRSLIGPGIIKRARIVDVIIPVHGGGRQTLACIDAALRTLDESTQILVVDDATEESDLVEALDALAAQGRIVLIRNQHNLGFVASVNKALTINPTHDVILLNSDTLVFADWLARLRVAAYSGLNVGTVTPLSNNGSIASYPRADGCAFGPDDGGAMHELAASTHSGRRFEIPVGVGFCLYLRRDCLQDVGDFDAAVFGAGYGEETDYCLRARRRGWSHQLAADVFVYHAGGLSFGPRRAALLERSQRLLNLRHPGFDRFIESFLAKNPLDAVRRRLDERRLTAFQGRFVLLVSLALTGGVERFVAERCRELRAAGLYPLVLKAAAPGDTQRCAMWTDAIEAPNLRYDVSADLPDLKTLLQGLPIDAIEIQHFLHLDSRVIDMVRALPIPYDVFVHDYAWICPRITLIDGSGRYCGEPAVSVCEACVSREGSNLGETLSVAALRERSDLWLRGARRVGAPSVDTANRLQRHFPDLQVFVQPHAVPIATDAGPPRARETPVRVALIGAIGEHKGYHVLLDCARDANQRGLPIEFLVIGYTENDAPLLETRKVFITGRYGEGEAPHLLKRERPDIAWMPSVWPETWCYTLDFALQAGLPVAAFDLGAIAERLRAAGQGDLLPLGMAPSQINDRLLALAATSTTSAAASRSDAVALPNDEEHDPVLEPVDELPMNARSTAVSMDETGTAEARPEPALSASVQVLPLPEGLYLFSVTTSGARLLHSEHSLALPAMHVGLGPGVPSGYVEFMEGSSTHGAWLFAATDLLVAKIHTAGATLILTTVRGPGGESLSIKIERLNARVTAAAPRAAATLDPPPGGASRSPLFGSAGEQSLPVSISAHVRTRGDMLFRDVPWAGRVGPGLWIESFSVQPAEPFGSNDIEYKALTASGFETPWLSENKMCGTKGMAVPLVGFAMRLKASHATIGYDCEYSGYFQSGVTVGPMRNGAPCRSTVANDPLEGIQIRLLKSSNQSPPGRGP
jgi:GT2 family glycosyltransferase